MTEKIINAPEQKRSRDVIEADSEDWEARLKAFAEGTIVPIRRRIEASTPETQGFLSSLSVRLHEEDVPEEEIRREAPEDALEIALQLRIESSKIRDLFAEKEAIEKELLPYKKEDFEKLLRELSGRINYDRIFGYCRDSKDFLLHNVTARIHNLRKYQYALAFPDEEAQDFSFFDEANKELEKFLADCEQRGLCNDIVPDDFSYSPDFGDTSRVRREAVAKELGGILEELNEYSKLSRTYQHTRTYSFLFDLFLSDLKRALEFGNSLTGNFAKEFKAVDLDPAFIDAAQRHINQMVGEHRKNGHLLATESSFATERARINAIETDPGVISFEGFDPPKEMVSVLSVEEVNILIRRLLPPDFLDKLSSISRKEEADPEIEDDPNIETIGLFKPIFDEEGQLIRTEIEVYRDLFVSKGADEAEVILARTGFLETLWHEFGHNAHHMMRFEELRSWEQIILEDKTAITRYVARAREDNEDRGKREDFSETFSMFMHEPALLEILSPFRYQFMREFFHRRLKDDQIAGFDEYHNQRKRAAIFYWFQAQMNPEDIRKIYLEN